MTAPFIQRRLANQEVAPRPANKLAANLIRDGWELRICPDCHNGAPVGYFCDHCFGAGAVLVPPSVTAVERRERNWRIGGIVVAVLLGLLAAWAVLR